jgi:hypothetical protein
MLRLFNPLNPPIGGLKDFLAPHLGVGGLNFMVMRLLYHLVSLNWGTQECLSPPIGGLGG